VRSTRDTLADVSQTKKWKMLHLLHTKKNAFVSHSDLLDAGIDCHGDTIQPIFNSGLVQMTGDSRNPGYALAPAGIEVLNSCVVARRGESFSALMLVDYPSAFVAMPFGEKWSSSVSGTIQNAVEAAGFNFIRGDTALRTGSLMETVATQIMQAGLVVADLSAANVNVFYELGIAHALGKDTFVLVQKGTQLAADFKGAHYYEYSLDALAQLESLLTAAVREWAKAHCCDKVKALCMAPAR